MNDPPLWIVDLVRDKWKAPEWQAWERWRLRLAEFGVTADMLERDGLDADGRPTVIYVDDPGPQASARIEWGAAAGERTVVLTALERLVQELERIPGPERIAARHGDAPYLTTASSRACGSSSGDGKAGRTGAEARRVRLRRCDRRLSAPVSVALCPAGGYARLCVARRRMDRVTYRPAVDGLRAIAIASVVGVHAFRWPANGGLGVDLFFVISGFLITTLLLEERWRTNRVALGAFYVRRAYRLVPALVVMLAVYLTVTALTGGFDADVAVGAASGVTYTRRICSVSASTSSRLRRL